MFTRKRSSIVFVYLPVLLALIAALVFSCSDQPTNVKLDSKSGGLSGSGTVNPGASGSFLLGSVVDTVAAPGHIEVWAKHVSFDSASGMVSFDVQLLNKTQRPIAAPIHFVITDIIPDDIALVGFDGVAPDGKPFMDFSSKLGSDNILTAGELSDPVTFKFHTVTARSFAIGFRLESGRPGGPGVIAGVVFRDDNKDGVRSTCEGCEPGIPHITVALEKTLPNGTMETMITESDSSGAYRFIGLVEGVYTVLVVAPADRWIVTSANPLLVTLVKSPDGTIPPFLHADFGLFPVVPVNHENLFGPILVGPRMPHGKLVDSTFVNPPSPLTVVFHYYIDVKEPPMMSPLRAEVDTASAWINDVLVYTFHRKAPPDTIPLAAWPDSIGFVPMTIQLPDTLVKAGSNTIRLFTDGNEHAALMWRVYKKP
ncbi:MAG TPA: SdrD B-like domain-containing protein [Candidatus Bathyarchaeia archaeon]|nr:SdrD B-like domain-containing protein [Candidatus Bathyarchaeia archaeon]